MPNWIPEAAGRITVGLDEVGLGPLAGTVVVAGVAIPTGAVADVRDSKLVAEADRYRLADAIRARADWTAVSERNAESINARGLRQCWRECVLEVASAAAERFPGARILMDGQSDEGLLLRLPALSFEIGGDDHVYQVAAASLVAKAHRDRQMVAAHARWPQYGFDRNKGYPVPVHVAALTAHGPCPIHRAKPVRKILAGYVGPTITPEQEVADFSPAEARGYVEEARRLDDHLDDWGRQFVADMARKLDLGVDLTPRQKFFLQAVAGRAGKRRAKAGAHRARSGRAR